MTKISLIKFNFLLSVNLFLGGLALPFFAYKLGGMIYIVFQACKLLLWIYLLIVTVIYKMNQQLFPTIDDLEISELNTCLNVTFIMLVLCLLVLG